ncbi:MAG: tetratricopeptide repeat protein, partial [Gammaproteobacteria bacterium]
VKSQYAIGEMYEKGKGTESDTNQAFKWYVKAAGKGNKKAAYKVGLFYYKGTAVTKDYKKARSWFTKSADKKYARAEYYLGQIYENGRGASRNYNTALKWYKRALAGGYGTAAEGIKRVASAQASRSKKVSSIRKSTRKAPPAAAKSSVKKTIKALLKSGWKKRKRPVEYFPSTVNHCKRTGENLECNSDLLKRNIGMADINYTTKAIIFGFKSDGRFKVSYRNNVKSIKVTSEEFAESGDSVPVKLGWQVAEHKLACKLENSKKIICTKNKTRKITLTR